MMFGYEVNEHVKLKILEEREADQLFKLVDSNREYLRVLAICSIHN